MAEIINFNGNKGPISELLTPPSDASADELIVFQVVRQIAKLAEGLNAHGYSVAMDAERAEPYVTQSGEWALGVNLRFTFGSQDWEKSLRFRAVTRDEIFRSSEDIGPTLAVHYPISYMQGAMRNYYIGDPDIIDTWTSDQKKNDFVKHIRQIVEGIRKLPDPELASRFSGFQLIPISEPTRPKQSSNVVTIFPSPQGNGKRRT